MLRILEFAERKEIKMKRFQFFCLICGIIFVICLGGAQAQEQYPNRSIELVCGYAPGGIGDVSGRVYHEELGRELKVPVNYVNRPGASGALAVSYVIRAKKDGYTLMATTSTPLTIMPLISKEVTYNPLKDSGISGRLCLLSIAHCCKKGLTVSNFE